MSDEQPSSHETMMRLTTITLLFFIAASAAVPLGIDSTNRVLKSNSIVDSDEPVSHYRLSLWSVDDLIRHWYGSFFSAKNDGHVMETQAPSPEPTDEMLASDIENNTPEKATGFDRLQFGQNVWNKLPEEQKVKVKRNSIVKKTKKFHDIVKPLVDNAFGNDQEFYEASPENVRMAIDRELNKVDEKFNEIDEKDNRKNRKERSRKSRQRKRRKLLKIAKKVTKGGMKVGKRVVPIVGQISTAYEIGSATFDSLPEPVQDKIKDKVFSTNAGRRSKIERDIARYGPGKFTEAQIAKAKQNEEERKARKEAVLQARAEIRERARKLRDAYREEESKKSRKRKGGKQKSKKKRKGDETEDEGALVTEEILDYADTLTWAKLQSNLME